MEEYKYQILSRFLDLIQADVNEAKGLIQAKFKISWMTLDRKLKAKKGSRNGFTKKELQFICDKVLKKHFPEIQLQDLITDTEAKASLGSN